LQIDEYTVLIFDVLDVSWRPSLQKLQLLFWTWGWRRECIC